MKKILVVDDDQEVRENLEEILHDQGYVTCSSASAEDALAKAEMESFQVILLDYMMPEKTGLDILAELKKISPRSKIIMITAFATVENAVEAIKKGANEYIAKPFKIEQLLVLIRQALEEILVITDMAMPNMAGDKLAVELIKIKPGIPVLLCTGFSDTMSEEKAASLGIKDFFFKPVVIKDLAQKIREVLA